MSYGNKNLHEFISRYKEAKLDPLAPPSFENRIQIFDELEKRSLKL